MVHRKIFLCIFLFTLLRIRPGYVGTNYWLICLTPCNSLFILQRAPDLLPGYCFLRKGIIIIYAFRLFASTVHVEMLLTLFTFFYYDSLLLSAPLLSFRLHKDKCISQSSVSHHAIRGIDVSCP